MILYLVSPSYEDGKSFALSKGWPQVAYNRFAMPVEGARPNDVRLVRLFSELLPVPGGIHIIRSTDFDLHPDKEKFDNLVAIGAAEWI